MNKKIKQYSALAIAAAAVLPLACKKENTNTPVTPVTPVTPSIDSISDTILNRVIDMHSDSIDLNFDNKFDFEFYGEFYPSYKVSSIKGINDDSLNAILCDTVSASATSGYTFYMNAPKTSGTKISAASKFWKNQESYLTYLYTAYGWNFGIQGQGDKFLGFRIKLTDGLHYGWMKVSLSSNGESLTVKDVAYQKYPNKEIAIGAK